MKFRIYKVHVTICQLFCLICYYGFARFLPTSSSLLGKLLFSKEIRYFLCKFIFKSIGKNVNIERFATLGNGLQLEIGDNSGLGINCCVPSNIKIGKNVMMGPNCYILSQNHIYTDLNIPMMYQGKSHRVRTVIEDDIWIGRNVTMTPGRYISKGSIIGACCLLCKNFPPYSIIGGNPSKFIKSRK